MSTTTAITSRRWIRAPPTWPIKPRSQSTTKMTIIVQSIDVSFGCVKLSSAYLSTVLFICQDFSDTQNDSGRSGRGVSCYPATRNQVPSGPGSRGSGLLRATRRRLPVGAVFFYRNADDFSEQRLHDQTGIRVMRRYRRQRTTLAANERLSWGQSVNLADSHWEPTSLPI